MNLERREFLRRTGTAIAIGAVATQSVSAAPDDSNQEHDVGTLGPAGSYSHRAALRVSNNVLFHDTMFDVADAVAAGEVETGVLPIENSLQGAVIDTLDILIDHELFVDREIFEEIRHALMAQSGDFDAIMSHSQALEQSNAYLDAHYPDVERHEVDSTSRGVELAGEDASVAAIAHPDLAEEFSIEVIAEDVQDVDNNVTRFFQFGTTVSHETGSKSTVLVYPGIGQLGLLAPVLSVFTGKNIDLLRIEARPSGEELGNYIFHIDFEHDDPTEIVCQLEDTADRVRCLGSYDSTSGE